MDIYFKNAIIQFYFISIQLLINVIEKRTCPGLLYNQGQIHRVLSSDILVENRDTGKNCFFATLAKPEKNRRKSLLDFGEFKNMFQASLRKSEENISNT